MERIGNIAEHLDELIHNLADAFVIALQIAFSCEPENRQRSK